MCLCSNQQSVWTSEVFCFAALKETTRRQKNYAHTLQIRRFFISATEWNQSQFVSGAWGKDSQIHLLKYIKQTHMGSIKNILH